MINVQKGFIDKEESVSINVYRRKQESRIMINISKACMDGEG